VSGAFSYYNEIDEHAADWLENLIAAGLIASGFVDRRSIKEVEAYDLQGFTQHHFFAGIGGWSYACRLAGWPDDRPIWTASCPCQPFSVAGKGLGEDDPRHLWPDLFRLWRAYRPAFGVGEQVAGKAGYNWFNGIRADLEGENFLARAVDIPACAVDAPHQRNRCYWVSVANGEGQHGRAGSGQPDNREVHPNPYGALDDMPRLGRGEGIDQSEIRRWWRSVASADGQGVTLGDAFGPRLEGLCGDGDGRRRWSEQDRSIASADGGASDLADCDVARDLQPERRPEGVLSVSGRWDMHGHGRNGTFWSGADWIICHDDKARRVADANAPMLVNGTAGRVAIPRPPEICQTAFPEAERWVSRIGAWKGIGNAIVPQEAAEVIGALKDVYWPHEAHPPP
jgi:DNA (cytosine-5)-methyltransferase 1